MQHDRSLTALRLPSRQSGNLKRILSQEGLLVTVVHPLSSVQLGAKGNLLLTFANLLDPAQGTALKKG